MKRVCVLLLVSVFLCLSSLGQTKSKLIPRELLYTEKPRTNFKLSPNGKHIYFVYKNQLRFCETASPEKIDDLVSSNAIMDWQPIEGASIIALFKGDNEPKLRIVQNTSVFKSTVPLPKQTHSAKILRQSKNKVSFAIQINSENKGENGIYIYNVKTNKLTKKHDDQQPATVFLDGNLNLAAAHFTNNKGGLSPAVYDSLLHVWIPIVDHDFDEGMFLGGLQKVLSVSNDGNFVYFLSNNKTDKTRLYRYNRTTLQKTELAKHDKVDLIPFGSSTDEKGNITSVVGIFADVVRETTSPETQKHFGIIYKKLGNDIGFVDATADNVQWLIRQFTGGSNAYYLYHTSTNKLTYLLDDYPQLSDYPKATRKGHAVTTRDGIELPVHVYLPPNGDSNNDGIPDNPLPTILYVHGGPWVGVVHWNNYFHTRSFQLLANRGYAVINCEFRGSTGLGKRFVDLSNKKWGTDMMCDKVDIANWAVEAGIAKKGKIGFWGWSYGGYAALAGVAFSPETYACAISMYGISDLDKFTDRPDYGEDQIWVKRVADRTDKRDLILLENHSPINKVNQIKAPILLTTGSKDQRVPQVQMDDMANALGKADKKPIYFYYPEEGHDYNKPGSWISFWAIAEQFLAQHLGGRYQPIGKDLEEGGFIVSNGKKFIDSLK